MKPNGSDNHTSPNREFATTHWSLVLVAGLDGSSRAAEAMQQLCRAYWYPLYAFIRQRGSTPHDAQDLTQEFFAQLLKRRDMATVRREKGKFRSFLLASLQHFLTNERKKAGRLKRGGILLSVHCDNSEWIKSAKRILESTGAEDVSASHEAGADFAVSDRPQPRYSSTGS